MKKQVFWLLGASSLVVGGLSANMCEGQACGQDGANLVAAKPGRPTAAGYKEIDTKALQELLASNTQVILLDARTPQFDDGRRIPGARLMPPTSSPEQIAELIPAKNSLVVVYCSSTRCPLSRHLAEKLVSLGYSNVVKYAEGLEGWTTAGNKLDHTRN